MTVTQLTGLLIFNLWCVVLRYSANITQRIQTHFSYFNSYLLMFQKIKQPRILHGVYTESVLPFINVHSHGVKNDLSSEGYKYIYRLRTREGNVFTGSWLLVGGTPDLWSHVPSLISSSRTYLGGGGEEGVSHRPVTRPVLSFAPSHVWGGGIPKSCPG